MKIGIDARFFGPKSKGLGRYTQQLINHLEKIDHDNDYVIFLRKNNFDLYKPKNKNFKKIVADFKWYSFAEQIFFPILLYKAKCDLIHFPHFNVPLLYFKKFIVTIHDLILIRYPTHKATTRNILFYKIKFLMYKIVIFCAVTRAKKIIAVSKFTKEDICDKYKSVCDKVVVVYESAEVESGRAYTTTGDMKDFQKYGIIEPYMLYVGNAYPHKNLNKLVDAFDIYSNKFDAHIQLVLVGNNDYFYHKLQQHIYNKKIKNIIILDTINDEFLGELYNRALLFVFPSLYEGFGLPPLEAQFFGVPVLASDHECMKEILSDKGALYCDATNVDILADAMHTIISSTALRNELIEVGKKNVSQYSWNKMAQKTNKIYEDTK
jgi:glycosyltransferase involved in cell wall biosynthesis